MRTLFFIIIFTATYIYGKAQYDTSKVNYIDKKGLKQGYWVKKYPDGRKHIEGMFKDGKKNGIFRIYHENGVLAGKLFYSLHSDTVSAEYFHENGQIMGKGLYVDSAKKIGEWIYYDRKGILSAKEFYNNQGKKDSIEYIYYLDGSVAKEIRYKNGFKNGRVVEYFDNGNVKFEGTYIDNNLDGIVKFYYPDGKLKQIGAYRDAVRHGIWTYYNRDGKKAAKEEYELGKLLKREIYDADADKLYKESTQSPKDSLEVIDIDQLPENE